MPSKSRKKIKGQARKAKAKEAAAAAAKSNTVSVRPGGTLSPITTQFLCKDGNNQVNTVHAVSGQFINTFFASFFAVVQKRSFRNNLDMIATIVKTLLPNTYNQFPEALNNEHNRQFVKKNLVSNGASYLLGECAGPSYLPSACAMVLLLIDSFDPSSPVSVGNFDERDANKWLTTLDIIYGCQRSLVKFFVKQLPCKCLDGLYFQVRSTTPKMGKCWGCKQMKDRRSLYICTGCERIQYCSRACQLADVSEHKKRCRQWQSGRYTYDR